MFFIKSVYCRVFQAAFRMALPVLPYREPEIVGSCTEVGKVLNKEKATSVLVVTDKGLVNNGLLKPVEDALKTNNIQYVIYDDSLPNPTVINVEDALKLYHKNKCNIKVLKPMDPLGLQRLESIFRKQHGKWRMSEICP